MKRKISLLLAILMILLAGCGSGGDSKHTISKHTSSKHAISLNDLKQALKKADYNNFSEYPLDPEEDFGLTNVSSATELSCYKNEENIGVEKFVGVIFFQCNSEKDALNAYNEIYSIVTSEGIYLTDVKTGNGQKSSYEEVFDSDNNGSVAYLIQVEDTVIFASESRDIDGSGSYDYELGKVLESVGY